MPAGLQSPLRKLTFALVCLLLISLYTTRVWRTAAAAWATRSQDLSGFQRAASLEPGNAEHRQSLGRYFSLVDLDLDQGRANYEKAASLNPHKARYWLDLALVHQLSGNVADENRALQQALSAEPTSLSVAWEAANLYVVLGDWESAFPLFRTVIQRDALMRRQAMEVVVRGNRDVNEILERALPPTVPVYVEFLQLLVRHKDSAAAGAVWSRLVALGEPVSVPAVLPYLNLLLAEQQGDRARRAWQDLARVAPSISRYRSPGNLVTNPGFEEEILGNGLDWRMGAQPGIELSVDEGQAHGGNRSLRAHMDGANLPSVGPAQFIPLQPSVTYRLVAYVKNDGLEGLNSPRLQIADATTGASLLLSDEISGSEHWHSVRGEFTTGPQTQLVIFRVVRIPRLGQVRGTLWLDDVLLEPVPTSGAETTAP